MDCEDHVVPPVKFLEPWTTIRTKAQALTLHENDAVHVQLTSGTSSSNREEERPPEPNILPVLEVALEQRTAMHRVWVASFADIYEDNIELLPRPCTLCHTLYSVTVLSNNTHETTRKKNCQMSVYHKADPGELIQ